MHHQTEPVDGDFDDGDFEEFWGVQSSPTASLRDAAASRSRKGTSKKGSLRDHQDAHFERSAMAARKSLAESAKKTVEILEQQLVVAQEHVQVVKDTVEMHLMTVPSNDLTTVGKEYVALKQRLILDALKRNIQKPNSEVP